MTSEVQKSQQPEPEPTLHSTDQITSPTTETETNSFPRRSLLKGATVAAATLGAFGGLTLPAHALPAHAAAATTSTSGVKLAPQGKKPTSFKYNLEGAPSQTFPGGTVRTATAANIQELSGMSISSESIAPGAMHELHWHINANELNYCLSGQGEIGILLSGTENAIFAIQPGSVSFVPLGAMHYIRNTGTDTLRIITAFTNENPERIDFSNSLGFIPRNLLAQTYSLPTQAFPSLPEQADQFLVNVGPVPTPSPVSASGPFTANFNNIAPKVSPGGTLGVLTNQNIPPLDGITLFLLTVQPGGLREPHWHPNVSELNYCVQGGAQFEIITPDNTRETFSVQPGDTAFVPQNYFHYIASTTNDPLVFLIFFSGTTVGHVDLSQITTFFPRDLIAASFGSNLHIFDNIPNLGDVSIAPKEM